MNTLVENSGAVRNEGIQTEKIFLTHIHQQLELPGECRLGECEGRACIVIGEDLYAPALVWVKRIRANQWEHEGELGLNAGSETSSYSLEQRDLGIDFEI